MASCAEGAIERFSDMHLGPQAEQKNRKFTQDKATTWPIQRHANPTFIRPDLSESTAHVQSIGDRDGPFIAIQFPPPGRPLIQLRDAPTCAWITQDLWCIVRTRSSQAGRALAVPNL